MEEKNIKCYKVCSIELRSALGIGQIGMTIGGMGDEVSREAPCTLLFLKQFCIEKQVAAVFPRGS